MVKRVWDQIESWMGWLVGWLVCLLYLPRSRSTEKRELKGAYILLIIIKKKPPGENVNKRAISASQEGLVCIYTADKTEQNPQKIRLWCHA